MKDHNNKAVNDVLILMLVAMVVGIYLIATTVTISRDGILYIQYAKELPQNFHELLRGKHPMGFPALILATHWLLSPFFESDSVSSWVLSGQICALLSRVASAAVLYFFGIQFFRRKQVFTTILVLTFLPYPLENSVNVLRDWPHILFLFGGLLFLAKGIKQSNWVDLGLAGITCGIGFILRPECAQVVIYGLIIFFIKLIQSFYKKEPFEKKHVYLALAAGFLMTFIPYTIMRGGTLPRKIQDLILKVSPSSEPTMQINHSSLNSTKLLEGCLELGEAMIDNLYYYFIFPAALGFYLKFIRKKRPFAEQNFIGGLFISFNCMMLLMLYYNWGYISKRHALPLCIMLCFYIPTGIIAIASYLKKTIGRNQWNLKQSIQVITLIGIIICLPKGLKPMGRDKQVFRQAAEWIQTHTDEAESFYTFDPRIPFYAQRENRSTYQEESFHPEHKPDYVICISKEGKLEIEMPPGYVLMATFVDRQKNKDVLIYQRED